MEDPPQQLSQAQLDRIQAHVDKLLPAEASRWLVEGCPIGWPRPPAQNIAAARPARRSCREARDCRIHTHTALEIARLHLQETRGASPSAPDALAMTTWVHALEVPHWATVNERP